MVRVRLYRRQGRLAGLVVEGHAGYKAYGKDVVCAAVSALTQTAVLALEQLTGVKPQKQVRRGYLECFLPAGTREDEGTKADIILETVALGLVEIERANPRFVAVERLEIEGNRQ